MSSAEVAHEACLTENSHLAAKLQELVESVVRNRCLTIVVYAPAALFSLYDFTRLVRKLRDCG